MLKYIIPSIMSSISPKKTIKLSPEILDKFIGKYKAKQLDIVVPLFRKGDKLYTRTSFLNKVELFAESESQFFGDSKNIGEFKIKFVKDKEGEVKQFIAYFRFRTIQFDKIK